MTFNWIQSVCEKKSLSLKTGSGFRKAEKFLSAGRSGEIKSNRTAHIIVKPLAFARYLKTANQIQIEKRLKPAVAVCFAVEKSVDDIASDMRLL